MHRKRKLLGSKHYLQSIIWQVIIALGFVSCTSDIPDPKIYFVGDSIVARWDINQDFPSYCVYNNGVGGSGIGLLNTFETKFNGDDVVVLTGTNDNNYFSSDFIEQYAEKYISTVLSLTDHQIYLFSVLPRDFDGDRANINTDIKQFNTMIQESVNDIDRIIYMNVYDDFMKDGKIDMRFFSDGLHPNTIGYEILTQKLLKAL